jgi:hypothetical protein
MWANGVLVIDTGPTWCGSQFDDVGIDARPCSAYGGGSPSFAPPDTPSASPTLRSGTERLTGMQVGT